MVSETYVAAHALERMRLSNQAILPTENGEVAADPNQRVTPESSVTLTG